MMLANAPFLRALTAVLLLLALAALAPVETARAQPGPATGGGPDADTDPGADPVAGDVPERVLLRELDTVGERRTETSSRKLTLAFQLPTRQRTVVDRTERELDMLTLAVDDNRRATGIRLTISRLRREHIDDGKRQLGIDPREGDSIALVDRGAVAEWRGASGFPLPAHSVAVGQSWQISGDDALAHFSDNGIYDRAEATFTLTRLVRRDEQLVAELSRTLTREGSSQGSTVREVGKGTLTFDVTRGRPLAVRTTSTVLVVQGGLRGNGTRTTSTNWSYRQMPLYRIVPRAQEGVTQREHAESVTELFIGAVNPHTQAQAVIHRHIETLTVTRRHAKAVDASGRPLEMVVDVPTSWQHTVIGSSQPGAKPDRRTTVGPLHALEDIRLVRRADDDGPLVPVTATVKSAVDARTTAGTDASLITGTADEQMQAALAALQRSTEPLGVPGVPSDPVPAGYTWSLPDELALRAFAGLLDGIQVRRVHAEALFMDVREWGGRPRVATLATRLELHGESADGLVVEAELPSMTYFDLDEGRPLAMIGNGRIAMQLRSADRRVEGRGSVRAHTRYFYDRGPGMELSADDARRRFAGTWRYRDPAGGTEHRLRLQLDGTLEFTHPDLQGRAVTESGHWRLLPSQSEEDPRLRLLVTIGAHNRDVYAVRLGNRQMELQRVDDTRRRTGIVPLLLGRTASWHRE